MSSQMSLEGGGTGRLDIEERKPCDLSREIWRCTAAGSDEARRGYEMRSAALEAGEGKKIGFPLPWSLRREHSPANTLNSAQ